jgi:hypothetical protein
MHALSEDSVKVRLEKRPATYHLIDTLPVVGSLIHFDGDISSSKTISYNDKNKIKSYLKQTSAYLVSTYGFQIVLVNYIFSELGINQTSLIDDGQSNSELKERIQQSPCLIPLHTALIISEDGSA